MLQGDNNKVWFAKLLVIFSYTSSSGSEIEAAFVRHSKYHTTSVDKGCNATVIISALICASDCIQMCSCAVLGSIGTQVSLSALTHDLPHVCLSSTCCRLVQLDVPAQA